MAVLKSALKVLFAVVLVAAGPVQAQTNSGWFVQRAPERELVSASVEFSNGIMIVAECQSDRIAAAVLNMPRGAPGHIQYDLQRSDEHRVQTFWTREDDGTTLLSRSARVVRLLKGGGRLSMSGGDRQHEAARLEVELPEDSSGLDAVLDACRYPTTNDRDRLQPVNSELLELPTPDMPARVVDRRGRDSFEVEISCLISQGHYVNCRSERETPADARDGLIMARELEGVRGRTPDLAQVEGRVLDITVTGRRIRVPY
jgi:hypothetical protein